MANPVRQTVVQRKNDPYIYLYVMGEWYCYNPQEPPWVVVPWEMFIVAIDVIMVL